MLKHLLSLSQAGSGLVVVFSSNCLNIVTFSIKQFFSLQLSNSSKRQEVIFKSKMLQWNLIKDLIHSSTQSSRFNETCSGLRDLRNLMNFWCWIWSCYNEVWLWTLSFLLPKLFYKISFFFNSFLISFNFFRNSFL